MEVTKQSSPDEQLLQESFERIKRQKASFVSFFYGHLLEKHPQLQPIFASVDMHRQQSSLIATLTLLAGGKTALETHKESFHKLGKIHQDRQIRAEHYPPFGDCLLESMAHFDAEWTPAHKRAWTEALNSAVRIMMESYTPGSTRYLLQVSNGRRR